MAGRKSEKIEKLVVNAIKHLQDLQGSSPQEISDFLSQEYSVPSSKIKKQVRLALRRGVSYGILQQKSRNTFAYNKDFLTPRNPTIRSEVVEPSPWLKYRLAKLKSKKSSGKRVSKSRPKKKSKKARGKKKKRGSSKTADKLDDETRKMKGISDESLTMVLRRPEKPARKAKPRRRNKSSPKIRKRVA